MRLEPKKQRGRKRLVAHAGGLSTKIHAAVDALGNPLRWRLTGGEAADIKQADALIEGLSGMRLYLVGLIVNTP